MLALWNAEPISLGQSLFNRDEILRRKRAQRISSGRSVFNRGSERTFPSLCHSHRVEKLLYLKWFKISKIVAIGKYKD